MGSWESSVHTASEGLQLIPAQASDGPLYISFFWGGGFEPHPEVLSTYLQLCAQGTVLGEHKPSEPSPCTLNSFIICGAGDQTQAHILLLSPLIGKKVEERGQEQNLQNLCSSPLSRLLALEGKSLVQAQSVVRGGPSKCRAAPIPVL